MNEKDVIALFESRSGRKISNAENDLIKFTLEFHPSRLPDFLGYPTMDDLEEAVKKFNE